MAFMLFFVFADDMFFYAGLRRTVPRFCLRLCSLAVVVREVVEGYAYARGAPISFPCLPCRRCSSELMVSALPSDGPAPFEPGREGSGPLRRQTDGRATVFWSCEVGFEAALRCWRLLLQLSCVACFVVWL